MLNKLKNFITAARVFIAEYELFTIPIFLCLAIFSWQFLSKIFFVVSPDKLVDPGIEAFYYAIFTLVIAFTFLLLQWIWFKNDSPQSAETMKKGWQRKYEDYHNYELIYANAKWFLYLFWLALIALAVFP